MVGVVCGHACVVVVNEIHQLHSSALAKLMVIEKKRFVLFEKNQAKFECCFVVVELELFRRSGRGRAHVVVLGVCLCLLRKMRASSLARAKRTKEKQRVVSIELARVLPRLPSCVGQGLLICDDRSSPNTSLASWCPCVSEPKRRYWRASVGAALARSFGWLESNSPWPGRFLASA